MKLLRLFWSVLRVCELCIACGLRVGTCFLSLYDLNSQNTSRVLVRIRESLSKPSPPPCAFFWITFLTSAAAHMNGVKFHYDARSNIFTIQVLRMRVGFKCKCLKARTI